MNSGNNNITWAHFNVQNQNTSTAFEKMCRLLFKKQHFNNKIILQAAPNNPGIEVEPVLSTSITFCN
ncbi:hypothetical protein HMPREF9554_02513 [Treponema phagedenis F0421]|nr:hypothetical protein HMPREF9554_02513 [Treponema phagedenis F0421]